MKLYSKKTDDIHFFFLLVVFERCFRFEDPGCSWGSNHLFCSRGRTCVLALEWDSVSHLHGEVAGVKQTVLEHIHTDAPCSRKLCFGVNCVNLFRTYCHFKKWSSAFIFLSLSFCLDQQIFLVLKHAVFYDTATPTFLTVGLHYYSSQLV